jgi:hypothetical protein
MQRGTFMFVALLVLGCETDRERDCATAREILAPPQATPRRYYDYAAEQAPTLPPHEQLRRATFKNDEVRAAVKATLEDDGWQMYSPYRVENAPPSAADRLAELCGVPRVSLVIEK